MIQPTEVWILHCSECDNSVKFTFTGSFTDYDCYPRDWFVDIENDEVRCPNHVEERNAMSNDIYINYLLDRTGSMATIWDATVSGFNEYKNDQANQKGTATITLSAFDSHKPVIDLVFENVDAKDCPDLTDQVFPRAMTPYLDALGMAIENTEDWLASNDDFDGKVMIVVNTDGYENASQEFTYAGIRKIIERKEGDGWTFVFMGAGIDAFKEAEKMGIPRAQTMAYAAAPGAAMDANARLSMATSSTRSGDDFSWGDDEGAKSENITKGTRTEGTAKGTAKKGTRSE